MVLKLQRTDRMGNAFDGVLDRIDVYNRQQELHDLVADFHADTDIDGSDLSLDAVAVADM